MANGKSVGKSADSSAKKSRREFVDFDPNRKSGRTAVFGRMRIITQSRRR